MGYLLLLQRDWATLRAIALRFLADSFLALAWPPFTSEATRSSATGFLVVCLCGGLRDLTKCGRSRGHFFIAWFGDG